jgi:hypothetical protein
MQIPFNIPVDPDAEWTILEKIIQQTLSDRGASEAMVQSVQVRMKSAWDENRFTWPLPVDEETHSVSFQEVLKLHSAMQAHVTRILFSRLLLEVELAMAKGIQ